MIHATISLSLCAHSYPIYVGQNIFSASSLLIRHVHGKQILIVTQESLVSHFLPDLQAALSEYQQDVFLLPDGEEYKNLEQWQNILDLLFQKGHERSTTLIALGGGVVGDITGFAAACYQRGVNYIQIPTTLVAQIDAAIGGKTAVNHPKGKNMVGAFHQPQCVIADVDVLQMLPMREYIAGLAEMIKYGLICDAAFFDWLEVNREALLAKETAVLLSAIETCASIKARIVSADERDRGARNLLNFGHTFGHALEAASGYQQFLHGEAVAIGMAMATVLSGELGFISQSEVLRVTHFLNAVGFQLTEQLPSAEQLMQLMRRDKKVQDGKLNFILLTALGQAEKNAAVNDVQLEKMLRDFSRNQ